MVWCRKSVPDRRLLLILARLSIHLRVLRTVHNTLVLVDYWDVYSVVLSAMILVVDQRPRRYVPQIWMPADVKYAVTFYTFCTRYM
jgi:hypothetical protein